MCGESEGGGGVQDGGGACMPMADSSAEPQGKAKNIEVGSLSTGRSLAQELNQSLLHCRRILYQLSYQRSPQIGLNQSFKIELTRF